MNGIRLIFSARIRQRQLVSGKKPFRAQKLLKLKFNRPQKPHSGQNMCMTSICPDETTAGYLDAWRAWNEPAEKIVVSVEIEWTKDDNDRAQ